MSTTSTTASSTAFREDAPTFAPGRGKFREKFVVDVLRIEDKPFKTNIGHKEAYDEIYRGSLGLERSNFHGIAMSWQGHPVLTFRVANAIDIDKLPAAFLFLRESADESGNEHELKIDCEIRGVRVPGATSEKRDAFPKVKWISIEGVDYDLENEELKNWLDLYGTMITDVKEDNIKFAGKHDSDKEELHCGLGKLSVKMELNRDIPTYLPAFGKKIKIYYNGMPRQCTNCYNYGHFKADCMNEKGSGSTMWLTLLTQIIGCR